MISYKKLDMLKKEMLLTKETYLFTELYPEEELFSLTSQTKGAAVSITANTRSDLK